MTFIDSHCHLPGLDQQDKLEQVLREAKNSDVTGFINVGTSIKENLQAIEVAEKYQQVYATVAIYPHEHQGDAVGKLMEQLRAQVKLSSKIVAIGECGIDISDWKKQRPVGEQIELFEAQVKLSQELNLPLIIHNRNGDSVVLDILSRYKNLKGVVHCFDSTWETAQKLLDLGFYLSFSGLVTYKSRESLAETVKNVPANSYLLETDSPYLLPEPIRSEPGEKGVQKNEPRYVRIIGQKVAQFRQISLEEVGLQTTSNARQLFHL